MYCSHCGMKLEDDDKYCLSCGNKVNSKDENETLSKEKKIIKYENLKIIDILKYSLGIIKNNRYFILVALIITIIPSFFSKIHIVSIIANVITTFVLKITVLETIKDPSFKINFKRIETYFDKFLNFIIVYGILSFFQSIAFLSLPRKGHYSNGTIYFIIISFFIGLAISTIFQFSLYLVLEHKLEIKEALKKSFFTVKRNIFLILKWELTILGLVVLSIITLGTGFLISLPMIIIGNGFIYKRLYY